MRNSRVLAACLLAVVAAASCEAFPELKLGPLTISASSTPVVTTLGRPVTFKPATAGGGSDSYAYSVVGLPAGLAMDAATGVVSGSPTETTPTARTLQVTVTDKKQTGVTQTASFSSVLVNAAPIGTLAQGYANVQVTQGATFVPFTPMTVAAGTTPYVFTATGLPTGITVAPGTGIIGGRPGASNTAPVTVTITATDAAGAAVNANFTIRVNEPLVAIGPVTGAAGCATGQSCNNVRPVQGSGGTLPYKYSISPALPSPLKLDSLTGFLSGAASASIEGETFRVTVTGAANDSSFKDFLLSVIKPLSPIVLIANQRCTQGTACSFLPVQGDGGTNPLRYSVVPSATNSLPAGLGIDFTTGRISGTPTGTQPTTNVTITITDANIATATVTATFALTVNPPIVTAAAPAKVCTQGSPCNGSVLNVSGGSAPYAYSINPALPAGISLNIATGQITGPATVAAPDTTYTVSVKDQNGAPATSRLFRLTVNPPLVTTLAAPQYSCTAGALCAFTAVMATGGTPTWTYALSPTTLPRGLSFNLAGLGEISGTATEALADTPYTITVTDGAADTPRATSSKSFRFKVSGPLTTSVARATVSTTTNVPIASAYPPDGVTPVLVAGGTAPFLYLVSPSLPTGLSMNPSTGLLSGVTGTIVSNAVYTVTVSDAAAGTSSKSFTLNINPPPLAIGAVGSKACTQGFACNFRPIVATGGTPGLTYSIAPPLPAGLVMDAIGNINGIPVAPLGAAIFTVTIRDQVNATVSGSFALVVNPLVNTALAVTQIVCGDFTGCTPGLPATPVTVTGGSLPLTYTVTSGTLPAGLTLNEATGALSGAFASISAFTSGPLTINVVDVNGSSSSRTFVLSVLRSTGLTPPAAQVCGLGSLCTFTPATAQGGRAPYSYALTGALPSWATTAFNNATGVFSGTPNATQSAQPYTATVTDAAGRTSVQTFTLAVGAPVLVVNQDIAEVNCSDTSGCTTLIPFTPVTASGGFGTKTFVLAGGTLPSGLSFSGTDGRISGTVPTSSLTATTFTVTVTDQTSPTPQSQARTFILSVLQTAASGPTSCVANVACSIIPVVAQGGKGSSTYSVSAGQLAQINGLGLSFNTSTGAISGAATSSGSINNLIIEATDASGRISNKTVTITVNPQLTSSVAIPEIACDDLSGCGPALPLIPITATGGVGTKTFNLTGTLPSGLNFNTGTGQITGGPPTTALGTTPFSIIVTDQTTPAPQTTSPRTFNLSSLITTTTGGTNTCPTNAAPCSITPVITAGGKGSTRTWSVSGGNISALGLSLNTATGVLSGVTPSLGVVSGVVISVTDGVRTSSRTVTITVP